MNEVFEKMWAEFDPLFQENPECQPLKLRTLEDFEYFLVVTNTEIKFDKAVKDILDENLIIPKDLFKNIVCSLANFLLKLHTETEQDFSVVSDIWCRMLEFSWRLEEKKAAAAASFFVEGQNLF